MKGKKMNEFKGLIALAAENHKKDIKRNEEKFLRLDWVLNNIVLEVNEVRKEMKPNNRPHLEDELSDILWGWIILVEKLKASGYVASHEAIIKRGLKKYRERIHPLHGDMRDHVLWQEVKLKQKALLKEEKQSIRRQKKAM